MKLFVAFTVLASLLTFSEAGCSCGVNRGSKVSYCSSHGTYNTYCECWTGCNNGGCWTGLSSFFYSTSERSNYYCAWTFNYNEKCRNYYWKYDYTCSSCSGGYYRYSSTSCKQCRSACSSGQYESKACSTNSNQNRVCSNCTAVANCATGVTCTSSTNSQCSSCNAGYYKVDGTKDTCNECTAVANCSTGVTCSSSTNSQCSSCKAGYYKVKDSNKDLCNACRTCLSTEYQVTDCTPTINRACTGCNPVANCKNPTTCTTAHNSQCDVCQKGYFLVEGDKDECKPCKRCPPGFGQVQGTCEGTTDRTCETKQKTRIKFDKFYKQKNGRPALKKPTNDVYQFRAIGENGVTVAFFNEATMPTEIPENYRGATEVTFGKVSGIADCLGCANSVEYADKALVTDAEWSDLWIHIIGDKVQAGEGIYEEGVTTPLFEFDSSTSSAKKTSAKNLDLAVFTYGYYENQEGTWSSCPIDNPFPYIANTGEYYCCATAGDKNGQPFIHKTSPFTSDSCTNDDHVRCDAEDTTKKCYRYKSAE